MFLILLFSWLEKERKKQFKSRPPTLPPTIKTFFFSNSPYYSNPPPTPPPRLLVFDSFFRLSYLVKQGFISSSNRHTPSRKVKIM